MKRIVRHAFFLVMLLSCSTLTVAKTTHMISGLDAASHYHGKSHGKFYIRTGSFSHESNAKAYEVLVRSKTSYPVKMSFIQGYYVVTIGPIANATDVRLTANKILQDRQHRKSMHVKQPAKTLAAKKTVQPAHHQLPKNQLHKTPLVARPAHPVLVSAPNIGETTPVVVPKPDKIAIAVAQPNDPPVVKPGLVNSAFQAATDTLMHPFTKAEPAKKPERVIIKKPMATPVLTKTAKHKTPAKISHPTKKPEPTISSLITSQDSSPRETPPVASTPSVPLASQFSSTNWIVTVAGGEQFPTFNSSMTVNNNSDFPAPFGVDIYSTAKQNQPLLSVLAGRRWVRDNEWFPAVTVGVNYEYLFINNTGGTITQYSDPEFLNYNYSWNVASNVLLGLVKLNIFEYRKISPYIAAGLGGSYNHTDSYKEYALANVNPRTSPAFSDSSTLQFAYVLKAGIDWEIAHQIIAAAEYQYLDVGSMTSGRGDGPWSNRSLNLGSYRSNAVLLSVGYYFGS